MTPLLNYFKSEEAEYMHSLQGLDSVVVNLGLSIPPVWEPFQGSIRPNPMLLEHVPYLKSPMRLRENNQFVWMIDIYHHLWYFQFHPHAQNCF